MSKAAVPSTGFVGTACKWLNVMAVWMSLGVGLVVVKPSELRRLGYFVDAVCFLSLGGGCRSLRETQG